MKNQIFMTAQAIAFLMFISACCISPTIPSSSSVLDINHVVDVDLAAISRLDPGDAIPEHSAGILWYDARKLCVEGKGWTDTETFFERLPARAKPLVTPSVRQLSAHTAGIAVRFVSDASKISADWTVGGFDMKHMAATAIRGLDLYAFRKGDWKFEGTARPKDKHTTATIGSYLSDMPAEPTEFILYLPLYDTLTDLKIGIPEKSFIAPAPPRPSSSNKPIVFYGTSITQGGCASRSGMCHPAILGRWLDREVINLGFSGSGKMEPEMAALLAELDPSLYVLECLPNMSALMVAERVKPFVMKLREAHPSTPIVLVENPFNPENNSGNIELRKVYAELKSEDVPAIYFMPGKGQLEGKENGTVDGVHPTDLGFMRLATFYYPLLYEVLLKHSSEN